MNSLITSKDTIRKRLLKKRSLLDKMTVKNLSHFIQEEALASNTFKNSRIIAVYDAVRNEVRTDDIVKVALQANKDVYFPQWNPETCDIRFFKVDDLSELQETSWGTREPKPDPSREISRLAFDLIIVPGVVFDKRGYRLGYGYGGYDRILAGIADRAWGLAYDFQLLDRLPIEPHDVACARIITEKRLIELS
jgi:5-formyltetrahydrofolate cyclo-ligase